MAIEKLGMISVPPVGGFSGPKGGAGAASAGNFAEMLKDFSTQSLDSGAKGETMALKAVDKKADLVDIVTAVGNAEVTLDTVVTLRDRVIQAYQEIIRMPV